MRLPNGFGSVYKVKGNRRRPWIARVTTSRELVDGKAVQKYYYIGRYTSRANAMEALVEYKKHPIGERRDSTLGVLYEAFEKNLDKSKKTKETYHAAWKHLSVLEYMKIRDIKKGDMQIIIDNMYRSGLSQSSYSKVKVLAGLLFKMAMQDDIVDKNYAQFIDIPSKPSAEKQIFTDTDIKKLEKHSNNEWIGTVLILIYTGMRIGELLTLTKFNVDIKKMVITGGIKTDAGKNRAIPIHSKIQPLIQHWYDKDTDMLITRDGKRVTVDYYRKKLFYPALEEIGMRKLTPHAARHTFASMLNRAKVDTLSIQRIIGHSDYSTTANIYTHVDYEELREAIERI